MNYAEVAVNSPIAQRRSFCYSIPPELKVEVGQAVWVPFGSKILQGIVVSTSDSPSFEATKEICDLITYSPLLSSDQLDVAFWISKHYLSPLFDSVALMLPPGFQRRLLTFLKLSSVPIDFEQLNSAQRQVIGLLQDKGKVSLLEIERKLACQKLAEELERMI